MPIASLAFMLGFLPVCILLYYAFSFSRPVQNGILLLASLGFYALGQTSYLTVLLFSVLWSWALGLAISRRKARGYSGKALTLVAVIVHLLVLAGFRLASAALPMLQQHLGYAASAVQISAPLGLAWYTLQAVGYCLDVYRGDMPAERNPFYVGLYLSFFPKLSAGPLIDASDMLRQIKTRTHSFERFSHGICRFALGLAKKMLLADQLVYIANFVFTQSSIDNTLVQLPVLLAWLGVIIFGLQFYYELSGFADMAIGLGQMFGFQLPENFRHPFAAADMTDFWRRWNITIMGWFRNYVFGSFPQRENEDMLIRDLAAIWLCLGLWHGFGWTFVFWGAWNFLVLLAEHLFSYTDYLTSSTAKSAYMLLMVGVGLVLLKTPNLYTAGQYFGDLLWLGNNAFTDDFLGVVLREYWAVLLFGVLFTTPVAQSVSDFIQRRGRVCRTLAAVAYPTGVAALFLVCLFFIVRGWTLYPTTI